MKNQALKNLLAAEPKALKNLHEIAHMDFSKPYFIQEYIGKFTENSILKEVNNNLDDINRSKYNIFLLYKPDPDKIRWSSNYMYIAQIRNSAIYCTKEGIKSYYPYIWSLFHMGMKKDFETIRKNEYTRYWLIIQAKELENYTEKKYPDKERYLYREEYGIIYIKPKYYNYPYIRAEQEIDKSGYTPAIYRDELNHRLAEIRRKRSEAAAHIYDNTEKLKEIEARLQAINGKMIDLLNDKEPRYKTVSKAADKLHWRYDEIKEFRENNFANMERLNWTLELIESTLTEVENILD